MNVKLVKFSAEILVLIQIQTNNIVEHRSVEHVLTVKLKVLIIKEKIV